MVHLTPSPSLRSRVNSTGSMPANDDELFTTPTDLLCPITHELFVEPVINLGERGTAPAASRRPAARRAAPPPRAGQKQTPSSAGDLPVTCCCVYVCVCNLCANCVRMGSRYLSL
jgi:hypothetical protein